VEAITKCAINMLILAAFTIGDTNNPQINGQYFADDQDVVIVTAK
jgi:hypothetical protein